jgi:hypothetical protein
MIQPEWFEILGVQLACVEILNPRGGQYTWANRNQEWLEEWLGAVDGRPYISSRGGGGFSAGNGPTSSVTELVYYLRSGRTPFPYDGGQILSFSDDPWVKVLVHGCDFTPERAWVSNPIWELVHRLPYKTQKQRKIERKGGPKHESTYETPNLKFSREEWSKLSGGYDRDTSLYQPRETTWSVLGEPLTYHPGNAHLFTEFPSKYKGALWIAPDGWTLLSPENTTEIIKTGLSREEADQHCEDHRLLLQKWFDKKKEERRILRDATR